MKKHAPAPDDLTLDEITRWFDTDQKARDYLEGIRWANGPVCPHCLNDGAQNPIWALAENRARKVRPGLRECSACGKQFTVTDEAVHYTQLGREFAGHQVVNHSQQEWVRGSAHTNTVEGFFSLLKRGIVGTFHHVSARHLPLYLAEFDYRYSSRRVTDGQRTFDGLRQVEGKRMVYRRGATLVDLMAEQREAGGTVYEI